jgi:hypothetical protein
VHLKDLQQTITLALVTSILRLCAHVLIIIENIECLANCLFSNLKLNKRRQLFDQMIFFFHAFNPITFSHFPVLTLINQLAAAISSLKQLFFALLIMSSTPQSNQSPLSLYLSTSVLHLLPSTTSSSYIFRNQLLESLGLLYNGSSYIS